MFVDRSAVPLSVQLPPEMVYSPLIVRMPVGSNGDTVPAKVTVPLFVLISKDTRVPKMKLPEGNDPGVRVPH